MSHVSISTTKALLSEKQAATRLGISPITLLRARRDGRIKFYRIGTRVLFDDQHLSEFLAKAERNGNKGAKARDAA